MPGNNVCRNWREQLDGGPQGPTSIKGTPPLFEMLACTEVGCSFLLFFPIIYFIIIIIIISSTVFYNEKAC